MFGNKMVDLSEKFPRMPCGRERMLRLTQDPVAAADFFKFSFKSLFRHLLGWDFKARRSTAGGGEYWASFALSMEPLSLLSEVRCTAIF
jgi:hypothetical protein